MKLVLNHRSGVLLICLLGASLRFYDLGSKSIWLDEAFTLWVARHSFPEVWEWIARIDQHPPLFYLLLSGWVRLFGDSEAAIRSLTALLGTLTLPLFYLLAKRVTSSTGAIVALLLLAINPFHIHYAQETRMYTLLALAGCGAIYFGLKIVETGKSGRLLDWSVIGLAFFQAIGMWTHNTFVVFFPLAFFSALGLSAFRTPHSVLRKLTIAQLLAAVLWSPWLGNFVRQSIKVDEEFWISFPGPSQIFDVFRRLLFDHFTITSVSALCILFALGFAMLGFFHLSRKNSVASGLLLACWLVPFLAELLLSFRRPLLHPPSLIWTSLPLYLLVAVGIVDWVAGQRSRTWQPIIASAMLLWIIALSGIGLSNYYQHVQKEQWREVARFVSQQASADDLLLFNATWVQLPFEYYARRDGLTAEMRGLPVDLFERGVTEPRMSSADRPYLRQLIANRKKVWLVYSHDWYTDPQQLALQELRSQLSEVQSQQFEGVRVFAFQK